MTFAISLCNADQIILASDRRLTDCGETIDGSYGKVGFVECDDATFVYCFTGLATIADIDSTVTHSTSKLLADIFYQCGNTTHIFHEVVYAFANSLTEQFASLPQILQLPDNEKRLAVLIAGYAADSRIVSALVSNDLPGAEQKFTVCWETPCNSDSPNPTLIQHVGASNCLTEQDVSELCLMLEQRKSSESIRKKAIALIQKISSDSKSGETVGKQVNTLLLNKSNMQCVYSGYGSDQVENVYHMANKITINSGEPLIAVRDIQFNPGTAEIFPRVHRNAPCPCGSGKKFRLCHRDKKEVNDQFTLSIQLIKKDI